MMRDDNGNYIRAIRYIARKEDFQKAITEFTELNVIGVYPNGEIFCTNLLGHIETCIRVETSKYNVHTSKMKPNHYVEVCVI